MTLSRSSRNHSRDSVRQRDSQSSNRTSRRWTSSTDTNSGNSRRRSRSPPPSSQRTARHERSPSPRRTAKGSAATKAGTSDSDDVRKLSVKERLAMWKKRKELEKGTGSPTSSAAESPVEPPTRPMSRTSSMADESNDSSRFVTAPSSVPSDHDQKSPTFTSASSGEQPTMANNSMATERQPQPQSQQAGIKLKMGLASSKAKPLGKFGKVKLAGPALGAKAKRTTLSRPSPLASSVFGADTDDNEVVLGLSGNGAKRKLVPLPPIASTDYQLVDGDTLTSNKAARPPVSQPLSEKNMSMDVDGNDEVDPLEEYMQNMESHAKHMAEGSTNGGAKEGGAATLGAINAHSSAANQALAEDDMDDMDDMDADVEDVLALAAKRLKRKEIAAVDHSKMKYESFKRNFYIEPAELRNMDPEEVDRMRADLGGIKIRGVDAPKPATSWSHFGLPAACADVIKHQGFEKPTPVQAQTVPAILSGRDVIGVAKTGSGKTLAFILPMLRHIKAQRPLAQGDGPIGLVMTPTRELAVQIHRECKPFLRPLGLRAVCAYGGSAIKDQIGELKRGCEIVVCTPGRLIDLLCANSGRVTNLHRVTYLVLDEADRMFDMGFEPQVSKIVQIVRPSRQTVMFSATFPRQMEALARKTLRRPLEIVVGGRALIPPEVTMHAAVLEAKDKFLRLLGILGESFNNNSETLVLIFVDRQEAADTLLRDLMHRGYVCNSLHGGKDQTDRDQAIIDFKNRVYSVLIATSVAARGLDVRGLNVVINYDCPNHMEDLVHRVGRTGRAGNKGDAYTFITPDQDRYANEVVKAMKLSELTPPDDVQELADLFLEKVRQGKERHSSSKSGFGGKGLEKLDKDRSMVKKIQKMTYGSADGDALDDDDEDEDEDDNHVELDSDGEIVVSSKRKAMAKGDQSKDGEVVRRLAKASDSRRPSVGSNPANGHGSTGIPNGKQAPALQTPAEASLTANSANAGAIAPDGGISDATKAAILAAQAAARRLNIGAESRSHSAGNGGPQVSAPLSVVDQINQQLGISPISPTNKRDGVSSGGSSRGRGTNTPSRGAGGGGRENGARTGSSASTTTAAAAGDSASGTHGGSASTAATAAIPVGAFGCELDINDYPQTARWKATNRDTLTQIIEQTGVAITTRGIFVPPGKPVPEGERKLYLSIEGDAERAVEQAKTEIKRILTEATVHIMEQDARAGGGSGRYSVV
ncbi:pre-mRNA processing RNA-helicase [Coemansia sp. RSA 1813]|nr:pre-mRNA processing RNA-helicase [Coemansia sp. RSA 1843]KAJ2217047.1 pre-mRNA processing RNA-helicase [Coemansia sp. RSA 487]KAJ2566563.1 pre-mRNA processing RNA-helicase [Coemansia sp. RSA 1813]